ncbi:MAG TPA: FecR family protein [Candidatus Limnocylindrales bacterium]|nr:FecR family protein [Candidatus Limnocylindrales bacterium]
MRRSGISLLLFGFALLSWMGVSQPAHASGLSYARIVRLSLVAGDVQVTHPGHSGWEPAVPNMPIMQGMTIGTNDGRAEVQFEDGSTAWISGNTLVQFTELALSNGGRITKLTLAQGTVSIYAALKRADTFSLAASREQITVPKHSLFRVDSFHDGASVSVLQGELQLTSSAGTKMLFKGQTFTYKKNLLAGAVSPNPRLDAWDRWVSSRQQTLQVETARSLSYANAPFSYGMSDLSAYGVWNYFAGYGYGWQPFGMGFGWTPFSDGEWASYPGLGWTWIGFEPWGWVPYHFGNWAFSPIYGWMWFPDNFGFWNPAPVNWYTAGNQVAWSPANPRSGAGSKYPAAPRILIISGTKSVRGFNSVRILRGGVAAAQFHALPAGPLENGKAPRFGETALAANRFASPENSRAVVPTAPSMAHLQKSLLASSAGIPLMKMNSRLPSAPAPRAFPVENAMRMPAALPHRPAPMYFPRESPPMGRMGANPSAGFGMPRDSGPTFSAPQPMSGVAPAPAPAAHPVAPGRPR